MNSWRMAKSLEVLRKEINGLWPDRDKTADGGIGDTAHAARPSKHNPGPDGIVEARDFDEDVDGKDVGNGRELWSLVQYLVALGRGGKHPALGPGAFIIYEGRIWSQVKGWIERPYNGPNAHERHMHVAVADGAGKDSTAPWGVEGFLKAPPSTVAKKPDRWLGLANPPMRGQDVLNVQKFLNSLGNELKEDGIYDREVADVVQIYKTNRKITEKGWGPQCWAKAREEIRTR